MYKVLQWSESCLLYNLWDTIFSFCAYCGIPSLICWFHLVWVLCLGGRYKIIRCWQIDCLIQISYFSDISASSDADMDCRKECLARRWWSFYAAKVILIFYLEKKYQSCLLQFLSFIEVCFFSPDFSLPREVMVWSWLEPNIIHDVKYGSKRRWVWPIGCIFKNMSQLWKFWNHWQIIQVCLFF